MSHFHQAVLLASLSLCNTAALAQQTTPAPTAPAAPIAAPVEDPLQRVIAGIKRTLEQRPNDPTLYFYLASFQARAKETQNALASLRKMHELGDGFLPGGHFGFDDLKDNPEFIALRAEIERKLPVVANAALAFRISDKGFSPEGIAWDEQGKHFYIGSVLQKKVARFTRAGKESVFAGPESGLQQVLGVAVDGKRRLLYAVSTNALTNSKPLHNAVFAFDLGNGSKVAEYPVPEARQLNDVAISADGDLYVSDSAAGGIYKITASQKPAAVSAFIPAGTLGGSNGLALSADGKTLFVAHSTGMVRVDVATAKLDRLAPPARQTISGVDGLYVYKGDLIGIQNLTSPGRVIRVRLSENGTDIKQVDTLQSHHNKFFLEPTTGAIADDHIHVLTTILPDYTDKGELENSARMQSATIVKVPLGKP
ncbi:MAG: SMP-30/gluconolactonase/LRE family protein [Pseudomonadota bacterium]